VYHFSLFFINQSNAHITATGLTFSLKSLFLYCNLFFNLTASQRPISLYSDPDAEYLAFPTIYCGQKRVDNKERSVPVHYSDIVKWELRSVDRRVAQSVPNIFFKLKKIQLTRWADQVVLSWQRRLFYAFPSKLENFAEYGK
jgi:hypothetical protein